MIYLREVLTETLGVESAAIPTNSFVTWNNLYQAGKSTKSVEDRRLRLKHGQIQECTKESKVAIVWLNTDDMLVDCLTKREGKTNDLMDRVITQSQIPLGTDSKNRIFALFWS